MDTDRGPLRRLAEVRGWVGGFDTPHQHVTLVAADGTEIGASYLAGPTADAPAVVVCHGFAAHREKPAYARLADRLRRGVHVLTLDHRGHGTSNGVSTLGVDEWQDVAAAVGWFSDRGQRTIVPVGVSMGGAAVLQALAAGVEVSAAVLVSTGAYRGRVRRPGLADLDEVVRHPVKRTLWQWLVGFRFVHPSELDAAPDPIAHAVDVRVPALIVHGEDDDYFPPSDADQLADAIPAPTTVWHEPPGFGHAETGITHAFADRLADAIVTQARTGRFPPHDGASGS
ncbi:MAG: alpha/beta fold hydrolase [Nitriliruptorales bacterium]|nr:alpha/beta fold hydrolase [Nitriliruptorales bacterium]